MELTDTSLKWPWLVVLLSIAVIVLLVVWARVRRDRTPRSAAYVAHTNRLRSLPRFQVLAQRRMALGVVATAAALVAAAGGIVLGGRVQATQTIERSDSARDIILCLDASGSTAEWNVDVLQQFDRIVEGLEGERIGLTVWNSAALTKLPLTDDYEFVREQLAVAQEAFEAYAHDGEEFYDYTAGTVLEADYYERSSLVGDGLVSCVQRFDRLDEERGRAVVLSTDNETRGEGVYTLEQAGEYAAEHGVVVHGIANPGEPEVDGDLAGFEQVVTGTGGTYSLLEDAGSAEMVVEEIDELEAAKVDDPPVRQTLDRPQAGTVVAGIGVGLLVVIWIVQAAMTAAGRRRP